MKYKDLKKLLKKTQLQLAMANKTVHDLIEQNDKLSVNTKSLYKQIDSLMKHSDMQERHQQITEDALGREYIIREYLEDRNTKLIQAMA